jgi:hypothetical protein
MLPLKTPDLLPRSMSFLVRITMLSGFNAFIRAHSSIRNAACELLDLVVICFVNVNKVNRACPNKSRS